MSSDDENWKAINESYMFDDDNFNNSNNEKSPDFNFNNLSEDESPDNDFKSRNDSISFISYINDIPIPVDDGKFGQKQLFNALEDVDFEKEILINNHSSPTKNVDRGIKKSKRPKVIIGNTVMRESTQKETCCCNSNTSCR